MQQASNPVSKVKFASVKIKDIQTIPGRRGIVSPVARFRRYRLDLDSSIVPSIVVDGEWYDNHRPQVGGMYVVYRDGRQGFLPAPVQEENMAVA